MNETTNSNDGAKYIGCLAYVLILAAALIACVVVGVLFGIVWGLICLVVLLVVVAAFLLAAFRVLKRRREDAD